MSGQTDKSTLPWIRASQWASPASVLGADEMKPSLHLRSGEGEGPEAGAADMLVSCLCGV